MNKLESPCPKDAPCYISMHICICGQWFIRRRFLKIYQNFPYFALYWAPIGANLNSHPESMFNFLPSLVEIAREKNKRPMGLYCSPAFTSKIV